jgi:uncharacterized membrane protein YkvA (DUF1232 family)
MTATSWLLGALAVLVVLYVLAVAALLVAGGRTDARALAGFVPDCAVLGRRLLADRRVPRRRKALLVLLIAYLAMPIDLVPDVIPVAGQLDDLILVAVVLRRVLRGGSASLLDELWPGPDRSRDVVRRLAFAGRGGRRRRVVP